MPNNKITLAKLLVSGDDAEREFMATQLKRCDACGHLALVHNDHCCHYCKVPDCQCRWGEIEDVHA